MLSVDYDEKQDVNIDYKIDQNPEEHCQRLSDIIRGYLTEFHNQKLLDNAIDL